MMTPAGILRPCEGIHGVLLGVGALGRVGALGGVGLPRTSRLGESNSAFWHHLPETEAVIVGAGISMFVHGDTSKVRLPDISVAECPWQDSDARHNGEASDFTIPGHSPRRPHVAPAPMPSITEAKETCARSAPARVSHRRAGRGGRARWNGSGFSTQATEPD